MSLKYEFKTLLLPQENFERVMFNFNTPSEICGAVCWLKFCCKWFEMTTFRQKVNHDYLHLV